MSFTEEQLSIIESIVNKRIIEHDRSRSIIRRELMTKLNSLKEDEDDNIQNYVLAVKTKINYDTTNDDIINMIDDLRDTIRSYKLICKQTTLEEKYASLLKCKVSELKLDLNWSCDDDIKENIATLKKLILEFPTKRWWLW